MRWLETNGLLTTLTIAILGIECPLQFLARLIPYILQSLLWGSSVPDNSWGGSYLTSSWTGLAPTEPYSPGVYTPFARMSRSRFDVLFIVSYMYACIQTCRSMLPQQLQPRSKQAISTLDTGHLDLFFCKLRETPGGTLTVDQRVPFLMQTKDSSTTVNICDIGYTFYNEHLMDFADKEDILILYWTLLDLMHYCRLPIACCLCQRTYPQNSRASSKIWTYMNHYMIYSGSGSWDLWINSRMGGGQGFDRPVCKTCLPLTDNGVRRDQRWLCKCNVNFSVLCIHGWPETKPRHSPKPCPCPKPKPTPWSTQPRSQSVNMRIPWPSQLPNKLRHFVRHPSWRWFRSGLLLPKSKLFFPFFLEMLKNVWHI